MRRATAALLALSVLAAPALFAQAAHQPPQWVEDGVLYEIFPRQFSAEGNFAGITAQLDRLKDLGVTILWIMPVNEQGVKNKKGTLGSPYAVKHYGKISLDYGNAEDLKHLVSEAHQRGMKVILDVVMNHTSWDNFLMVDHPDWYHRDAKGNVISPEDWTDVAWLDYGQEELREYMIKMLRSWVIFYDVDGFRCDVAFMVPTDFWEEARRALVKDKPGVMMLAEASKPELLREAFDLDYAWPYHTMLTEVLQGRKPASALRETWQQKEVADYPPGAWHMVVADDHDERRAIARFGEPGALAASFLAFTLPGVPLVYNGMEVGDTTESRDPALFEKMPIFWNAARIRPQFPAFFKGIIALRREHEALRRGALSWAKNSDEARVLTFVRKSEGEEMLVAVNVSNQPFAGSVDVPSGWREVPVASESTASAPLDPRALSLDAWQGRVFVRSGGGAVTDARAVREHADGRVELVDESEIRKSPLYNHDLAPVPVARRNWTTYNYAALWISMAHCIPTYMLAAGLMTAGMSWAQAIVTILLGNTIVLVPILLNSHPGTKYGIPFPVFARAAYGTVGSNLPALMRALVACGWFGIQAWIGGEALQTFFTALLPGWPTLLGAGFAGHTTSAWLSFLLFWGVNIAIIYRGMDLLRKVENWAAPFVLVMTAVLLGWAVKQANGFGPLLHHPGKFGTLAEFLPVFVPSLTAMIGFWATLSLNMPDFTRFGRSQREQMIGQVVALPTTMTLFAAMGVLITSATIIIYGAPIWDPIQLAAKFQAPLVVAVSMFTAVVATLAVNIAANVVSPANDFANAFPRHIDFKTGGLITGLVGMAMQPWKLLADPSGYIFQWLLGYSGGLGSIAGVLIADYWVVRKRRLELADLYLTDGAYRGWNMPGVVATVLGCFFAWIGVFVPAFKSLFDYAWFVGFAVAFAAHVLLMRGRHPQESLV